MHALPRVEFGIVGGSGLYALAGLEQAQPLQVETPFGAPSDALWVGGLEGRSVAFLARHGGQHGLLPAEINYRANVFAMKLLGVERILSVSAVGSMREGIHPRDVVLPDQFIDLTRQRPSTFFGEGLVAHVSLAEPVCRQTRGVLHQAAVEAGARVHDGGTYLCIDGPQFSTRAESRLYRSWGVDVIGMTNLQEAKLSREAEIAYATLALVTDYDCWHAAEGDVSVSAVLDNLRANADLAASILRRAVRLLPRGLEGSPAADALRHAILTPKEAIPPAAIERLRPIVGRYLD
jgi:5'-methylthioadenosine phosphorylase